MTTRHFGILDHLRLLWMALFDRRTPTLAKVLVGLGVVYGLSPLDLIPDFIPVIGQLDDLGVIIFVLMTFLRMTQAIRSDLRRKDTYETTAHIVSKHPRS